MIELESWDERAVRGVKGFASLSTRAKERGGHETRAHVRTTKRERSLEESCATKRDR